MPPSHDPGLEDRRRRLTALGTGLAIVVILALGLLLVTHSTHRTKSGSIPLLPFGAAEKAYADNIHIRNISMSEATNYLNSKFTYVSGSISNDGSRGLRALEITIEFHDPFHQVILRERRLLVPLNGPPLAAGQHIDFQITFEHIPAEWNRQYPSVRVTGLILQ